MGFWDSVGKLVETGLEKAMDYRDNYDDSYSRSSDRYANMSNERLKKEIERLQDQRGYDAERMGKLMAMKEELQSRRG